MNNALMKKLQKKPKWKLIKEREEIELQQKKIRMETEELQKNLSNLKDDEIVALKGTDGTAITLIEAKIDSTKEKIAENDKRYKDNANVLETYSKIIKNDREGATSTRNSIIGLVTGLGGLALGGIGLKMAYDSDMEGTLVNKKSLEWVKSFPIFKGFGKK